MVVDAEFREISSRAAAGLFNPITGRKMVKTWLADSLFEALMDYYPQMEERLGKRFFYPMPIYRPFLDNEEWNDWQGKLADDRVSGYIKDVKPPNCFQEDCFDPYGGLLLTKSGWVDLPNLLDSMRDWLVESNRYICANVDWRTIRTEGNSYVFRDIEAKWVVSCTGVADSTDGLWDWLPFRPVKGEVLLVETEKPLHRIYNRGVFVLPTDGNTAKVGSTYSRDVLSGPTEEGKSELLRKLGALLKGSVVVKRQWAGIRPATKDRRPLLGEHPNQPDWWVFNGLGAKGVSLGPFFVQALADAMFENMPLPAEVDIRRFGVK